MVDAVHSLSPAASGPAGGDPAAAMRRRAGIVILGGFLLLLVLSALVGEAAGLDPRFAPAAVTVYGAVAVVALAGLGHHEHAAFGAPNVVTTLRAVGTALFAGLFFDAARFAEAHFAAWAWTFAGIAIVALALDGLDGYLARRLRLSSRFGARYDMEVDALLILLLSLLVYGLGKAGPFVLAIGLMRYVFLVAQMPLPWLASDLPPSRRRKTVCVIQAVALGALVVPVIQPPVSSLVALLAVSLLLWSFALDIVWLARRRTSGA